MKKLSQEQINERLKQNPKWNYQLTHDNKNTSEELYREFHFSNFIEALSFVNRVGGIAEQLEHHPYILLQYGLVKLSLSTHDVGGITEKDFEFIQEVTEGGKVKLT